MLKLLMICSKAKIVGFKHAASTDNDISLTRVRVKEVESG